MPRSSSTPLGRVGTAVAALLLAALAGAACQQGGFYRPAQYFLGGLLVIAVLAALLEAPLALSSKAILLWNRPSAWAPVVLAGWVLLDGALHGGIDSGLRLALLVTATVAVLLLGRALDEPAVELLDGGLLVIGAAIGGLAWYGVAGHRGAFAIPGQGLWRAAGTLGYPNAAAALLAVLALVGIARRAAGSAPARYGLDGLLLSVVLVGLASTLSRGGLIAFGAGLLSLALAVGWQPVLSALGAPAVGALVALIGLVPAFPIAATPAPGRELAMLLLGLLIGALPRATELNRMPGLLRLRRLPGRITLLGGLILAFGALLALSNTIDRSALSSLRDARANLSSDDRVAAWHAVWHRIALHPLTGSGPGLRELSWHDRNGGLLVFSYAHQEYLQILAELGVVGLLLLAWCLVVLGRWLYRQRPPSGPDRALWALGPASVITVGSSALFDFTTHFPVISLTAAVLAGCAGSVSRSGRSTSITSPRKEELFR